MHHKKSKMATSESNATILKFSYVHVYIVLLLTSFQFEKGLNYSHTKEKKTHHKITKIKLFLYHNIRKFMNEHCFCET